MFNLMGLAAAMNKKYEINVYIDNGLVYCYTVDNEASAREHANAIVKNGYRSCVDGKTLNVYPAHRILKVKIVGSEIYTNYPDKVKAT